MLSKTEKLLHKDKLRWYHLLPAIVCVTPSYSNSTLQEVC